MLTEFEVVTQGIPDHTWPEDERVVGWVKRHANRRYVPEWLLRRLRVEVNLETGLSLYGGVKRQSADRGWKAQKAGTA